MIEPFIKFSLFVIFFYLIANYVENKKLIYNAIVGVVMINACMVLLQFFKVDPLCLNDQRQINEHMVGLFGYKMNLGAYMAMMAPLLLFNKRYIPGVIACVVTVLSRSWGAVGALGVALLFCAFFLNKKVFITATILFLIGGFFIYNFYLNDPDSNETLSYKLKMRAKFQVKLLPVIIRAPHLGRGLGALKYLKPQIINDERLGTLTDAWNEYIERAIEMGMLIWGLFLGLCYGVYRKFKDTSLSLELLGITGGLATIPLGMMFHSYTIFDSLSVGCIVLLSLFEWKAKEE